MRSVLRLYSESEQEKLVVSLDSEVGGYQSTVLSCVVRRRYQAPASEQTEGFMCAVIVICGM
jgi:hypothetical protein